MTLQKWVHDPMILANGPILAKGHGDARYSVVQWRPFFSLLFWVAAPLKMVFPKKGSLFFQGH